jgi:hypothetical protein
MKECAIGIRVHSGWGALVAVAGDAGAFEVIERRRIEIIDRNAPGAAQPYHFAKDLRLADAEKFIAGSAASATRLASAAMREVCDKLRAHDYNLVAAAILLSSGRPLPELENILAAHPMIHTAEGEFFRQAFRDACASLQIPVTGIRERDLDEHAKSVLRGDGGVLKKKIAGVGKTLGPPWTTDQKAAALAATIALAARHK